VDTPKGDLDASSGALTGPDVNVVQNDAMYPYGTSEQFPSMYDSDQAVTANSAHWYRECSNKGICDRGTGTCTCFEGYSGSACQRASCPVSNGAVCSGHGTCKDIKSLAAADNNNIYNLWDEHMTMGCDCDAGFSGPDCSFKHCKVGADPLYYDDFANVRYSNWTVQFYTMTQNEYVYGNYSLIFTDHSGEDWQTDPIDINANCMAITDALESLPNDVIPGGTVRCYKTEENLHVKEAFTPGTTDTFTGQVPDKEPIYEQNMFIVTKFILAFPANPGKLAPLKVNRYLDGYRPTLFTKSMPSTLGWHIFPNGFAGEDTDYVNDECVGVLASVNPGATTHYLSGLDSFEKERLKACLGDSNGVDSDNIGTYNWDYGNWMNPHLIKLVEATQDVFTQYVRPDGTTYKVQDKYASNGGLTQDVQMNDFPLTKLCTNGRQWVTMKGSTKWKVSTSEALSNIGQAGTNQLAPLSWNPTTGTYDTSGYFNIGQQGYCANINPPGFYAVLYFDDCSKQPTMNSRGYSAATNFCDSDNPFRLLTRAGQDYSSNTMFHIFTTKGYLQQVNQNSGMYTTNKDASATNRIRSYHSNVVHFTNVTESYKSSGFVGQIDCETTTPGVNGALDCVEKGDMVMFINLGIKDPTNGLDSGTVGADSTTTLSTLYSPTSGAGYDLKDSLQKGLTQDKCFSGTTATGVSYGASNSLCPMSGAYKPTAASLMSNPVYPNIYTVQKIGRNPKDYSLIGDRDPSGDAFKESMRHTATLDFALNSRFLHYPNYRAYQSGSLLGAIAASSATIYKFHPPTGYNYVGECSNRGVCNSATGVCQCFSGYTGDNCGAVNSLAM